ncbi:MAG TPA: AAA family ATPase, partial [Planctomycetaceae bacterium]|nr:AAA family ATPase [Planctomycetaceae bacterium]
MDADPNRQISQESIEKLSRAYQAIREQMAKVIVGQEEVIEHLLIALF